MQRTATSTVGTKRFAQCRNGRRDAAEALGKQRDHRQQRSAHRLQSATNRALSADRPDCALGVGRVYLLDGCGDAAGLLDGEHDRFDLIERAGHPRSQERR